MNLRPSGSKLDVQVDGGLPGGVRAPAARGVHLAGRRSPRRPPRPLGAAVGITKHCWCAKNKWFWHDGGYTTTCVLVLLALTCLWARPNMASNRQVVYHSLLRRMNFPE